MGHGAQVSESSKLLVLMSTVLGTELQSLVSVDQELVVISQPKTED